MKLGRVQLFVAVLLQSLHLYGVEGNKVDVVVPGEIQSVNGSSVDMGCSIPLQYIGSMMVCGGGSQSFLVDGCILDIDTSTSDWASQLVTVRRNEGTSDLHFPHVLLTFVFDTAVSLTEIKMDLFLCPDWNIGAPSMYVYLDPDYDLVFDISSDLQFVGPVDPSQSSCDSISNVTFIGNVFQIRSYRTVHILVDLSVDDSIEWVHVGEVRFIGIDSPECPAVLTTSVIAPSSSVQATTSLVGPTTVYTTITTPRISLTGVMTSTFSIHPSSTASLGSSPALSHSRPSTGVVTEPSSALIVPRPTSSSSTLLMTSSTTTTSTVTATTHSSPLAVYHTTSSTSTTSPSSSISPPSTTATIAHSSSTTSSVAATSLPSAPTSITTDTSLRSTSTFMRVSTTPAGVASIAPSAPVSTEDLVTTLVDPVLPVSSKDTIPATTRSSSDTDKAFLPVSTSTTIPTPPGKKDISLSLIIALTSLGISLLIMILTVIITVLIVYNKRLDKNSYKVDAYIEIGPLAPTRMDVPEDEEEFGVHKVTMEKEHENGNIYEVAK